MVGTQNMAAAKKSDRVEPYLHLPKASLVAYAIDGCPFYVSRDKTEKQFLSLGVVAKSRSVVNSEMLKRPEYGLSMMCSSVEGASTYLAKYGGDWMAKSGLEEMKTLFAEDSGKSFLKAAEFLNMDNKDLKRDADGVVEHTKHMVDWMQTDAANKAKIMRKVAMSSARLYLGSMALLEGLALADNKAHWTANIPKTGQTPEMKAWLKNPNSSTSMAAALCSVVKRRIQQVAARKRKASALSDDDEEPEVSCDESSQEKPKRSKKKQPKPDKKTLPSDSSDSDNASEEPSKKKKNKKAELSTAEKKDNKAQPADPLMAMLEAAEKREAALVSWKLSDVQEVAALVDTMSNGPSGLSDLQKAFRLLPSGILDLEKLRDVRDKILKMTAAPPAALFKELLGRIQSVAKEAEAMHEQHEKIGAGGSS